MWRQVTRMQVRGVAAAGLASLIGAGFSAQALAPLPAASASDRAVARGYEADDHFPGAAYFYAIDDHAAPEAGTTGTAVLPATPVPQLAGDPTIRAAAPFVLQGSPGDRARALQCLTDAIYYEAATEPDQGQRAVAQVVLNRVRHPAFPATVCGVVYQGSAQRRCQFSFACDGAMTRGGMARAAYLRAARVARSALLGQVFAPVGEATHYHTYAVTPAWNRGLVMTGVFGAHFFHRWKGWWGTPAAFSQVYRGNEPAPGPQIASIDGPAPLPLVPPPRDAVAPPAAVQPGLADSGAPTQAGLAAAADAGVLDKWKDSGTPLR